MLTPGQFSRALIESKDLDPVYVVLWNLDVISEEDLAKFLLAYFCFYHLGTASWIVDQRNYWEALSFAASTKEHARSSERRHFRGKNAVDAVDYLRELGQEPIEIINGFCQDAAYPTLSQVTTRVKELQGFGDWIAFKVADMLERLAICPVVFSPQDIFSVYASPREGAELVAQLRGYDGDDPCTYSYNHLKHQLKGLKAPPRYERDVNVQEIETCLCKYVSHHKGRYEVGKDIGEIRHALLKYSNTRTAGKLFKAGQKGGLWK